MSRVLKRWAAAVVVLSGVLAAAALGPAFVRRDSLAWEAAGTLGDGLLQEPIAQGTGGLPRQGVAPDKGGAQRRGRQDARQDHDGGGPPLQDSRHGTSP